MRGQANASLDYQRSHEGDSEDFQRGEGQKASAGEEGDRRRVETPDDQRPEDVG